MVVGGINTEDISVVVQGAVDKENTPLCLKSIRKYLPGSEIILSTWKGTNIESLDYDKVMLNSDPGGYKDRYVHTFTNNTLRQLVSTKNGLRRATRKYIIKMRSDLILKSNNFLTYFEKFTMRNDEYILFEHRVIISSFFTKKFLYSNGRVHPVPFHISDWFSFGLAEDIFKLYDIELPVEPDFSWYLYENKYEGQKINLFNSSHQYAPEQYIGYKAFSKKFNIRFKHYMDYNEENILSSEKLIINNFIILEPNQFKFICGKKNAGTDYYKKWTKNPMLTPTLLWKGLYRYDVYLEDYKKYCDDKFVIPKYIKVKSYIDSILHT
ncbi:WavE lipopolysaccharide synthesis family protein [uncultured Clostridium sp.]|uniref:WavE lipopolysaccharide synthesis family protein n=1 Tax=uncultured Clostridium sp. TaxID=59620 RepID=UPI0027DE76D2|nr:WavE lipopolysaccharide synthesis family protein [uncultured Clostridium sp.]